MQYECILIGLGNHQWLGELQSFSINSRLVLHTQDQRYNSPLAALNDTNLFHARYDAALIYVNSASISQWRAALSNSASKISIPLIIYADNLKAQTLKDFLDLGVSDFISPPFTGDELRIRIENAAMRVSNTLLEEKKPNYSNYVKTMAPQPITALEQSLCESILDKSGTELEAYAIALASQKSTNSATFKAAKNQIIARFEQAYIKASLNRYGGNVTQAARMAQKHRRAFWALMKKHNIDPNPYRIN